MFLILRVKLPILLECLVYVTSTHARTRSRQNTTYYVACFRTRTRINIYISLIGVVVVVVVFRSFHRHRNNNNTSIVICNRGRVVKLDEKNSPPTNDK